MATALQSSKQLAFIAALRSVAGDTNSIVSRSKLVEAAALCNIACPPAWIVKDASRAAGRGFFRVPELLNATAAAANTATMAPVAVPAASTVMAVIGATNTIKTVNHKVLGMTGGDRTTLIPDKIDTYVPWGHFSSIEAIIRSGLFSPMFITGLSGNGKTTMIEQVCAKLKRECYRVNITAETDESDLLGSFGLVDGNTVWQDGPVTLALKSGAVLLLDEIDLGSDKIMCLQSVLEGKGVMLKKIGQFVHPAAGFTCAATANTKGKGDDNGRFAGTRILNEAFLDRFDFTYEQEYAPKATEKKILLKKMAKFGKVDDVFADNLVRWAEIIRASYDDNAIDEIITTRRLEGICKAYSIFNDRMEAVKMCVSRFDTLTRTGMVDAYSKIDADVNPVAADAAPVADNGKYCMLDRYTSAEITNGNPIFLPFTRYEDKDTVRNAGARWDVVNKMWTITHQQYMATSNAIASGASNHLSQQNIWDKYGACPTELQSVNGVSTLMMIAAKPRVAFTA